MKVPALIVNFKTYPQSRGKKGIKLAKLAEEVAKEYSVTIIVAPQLPNVVSVKNEVDIPVYAQHIDPNPSGSATGHVDPFTLSDAEIDGTLLNHSERRLGVSVLENSINQAKNANLETIVCANTINLSRAIATLEPTAVAMEPPELIGGEISVTTRPEIVTSAIQAINEGSNKVYPLVGAGVKNASHVKTALDLGSKGVLLASGIVKHDKPKEVMSRMAQEFVNY